MRTHILSLVLLLVAVNSYSQTVPSSTENYIYTKTYLSKPGDPIQKSPIETIQYFDGIGRPKQILNVKASPLGKDIVIPIIYDEFGRQTKDYLPMPQSGSSNGAIYQQNPQSDPPVSNPVYPNLHQSETTFYSKKVLENSPLDRVQQQVQVGNAWSSKPVKFDYLANTSADKVMRFWSNVYWPNQNNNDLRLETAKYFGDNQLYKNLITDEDGNKTIEFKNEEGQTLLLRKELAGNVYADTYYIYNEFNNLAFVISPEASKKIDQLLPAGGVSVLDAATKSLITDLCYQYIYDGKNRLVEKKLPGKGREYMVYDKTDRLIMYQDTNLENQGKWLITKYDKFGRVICTGFHPFGSRVDAQNLIKDMTIVEERNGTGYSQNGLQIYYDRVYFYDMESYLSVNYYDSYPSGTVFPTGDAILGVPILKDTFPQGVTQSTKSLPTASFVKNIEDDKWTRNYTFYDRKARPIGTYSYNHLGGFTKTESTLDFTGVPQKTMTYHTRSNPNVITATVEENFTYDNQNRLTAYTHKVNANAPVTLAKNKYNEIGQLTEKEVGGDQNGNNPLQTVNYAYNIRGWMTGINSGDILYNPSNGSYLLTGGKLFGYNIRYNNPQNASLGAARYNGNIAEVDWISKDVSLKRYGYQYDGLNRLLKGNYQDPGRALPESHINDETLTYDLNGNIKTLVRNSKHDKQYTPIVVDNLGYQYNGNQVTNITDGSGNSSGYEGGGQNIPYDLNGNMIAMPDKGISAIAYNFLNLPKQINQNANTTNYYYRADGVKVKKKFTLVNSDGTKIIDTEYLDGFQYSTPNTEPIRKALETKDDGTMEVTKAGEEEAFSPLEGRELVLKPGDPQDVAPVLSFFPTAEGYYDYENFRYIYQYKDHLGNVRVSYVKNSAGGLEIMDRNDYYPFGMSFLKPFGQVSVYDPMAIPYNYKYNGKELQETGMYDYGARFYMPDIGRWGVVDPLAELYRRWSPYNYAMDNPIRFTDPDGMGVTGDFYNQAGKKIGTDGVKDQKVYVVTDNKEARQINRETKKGNLINTSNVQSKVELVSEKVRGGMMEAVARTGKPSGTDTKGNMHEEGGYYGTDKNGNEVVVASKPGDGYTEGANGLGVDPLDVNSTDATELATRSQDQKTGTFHVHPSGNNTTKFVQEPSGADLRNAGSRYKEDGVRGNNYVLGKGNNTVYIYNSQKGAAGTVIATFPLKTFSTVKAE